MKNSFQPATFDQIEGFYELLSLVDGQASNFYSDIEKLCKKSPKLLTRLSEHYAWYGLYDLEFDKSLAVCLHVLGIENANDLGLTEIENQLDGALKLASNSEDLIKKWLLKPSQKKTLLFVAAFHVLITNVKSLSIYGLTVNSLLQRGSKGDDTSFLSAVRMDPAVIMSSALNKRLRAAVIQQDRKFQNSLGKALQRNVGHKAKYLSKPRVLVLALHEVGILQQLSRAKRDDWLINRLGIIGDSSEAPNNLKKFISRTLKGKKATT